MTGKPAGMNWRKLLRSGPPFSQLSDKDLDDLLRQDAQELHIAPGKPIVREGEPPDYLYVLGRGRACATLSRSGGRLVRLATLEAGEIFGEMGLIQEKPRMATVIAEEECLVLRIKGKRFLARLHANPELEFKVLLMMSERLRNLTEHVLAERLADTDERLTALSGQLETELRIAEATKRATQAMFDETHKRASEVIHSFERTRAYFTWVGSALSAFVAILITIGAFLGLREYGDFIATKKNVEAMEKAAEAQIDQIATIRAKALESLQRVSEIEEQFNIVTEEITKGIAKQSGP